jgi:hypothetical protein
MDEHWITEDWNALTTLLPENWQEKAWELGALRRTRKIRSAEELLRLLLLHVGPGLSLQQAVVRAGQWGLPEISDVALYKRMKNCAPWLRWMCGRLIDQTRLEQDWPLPGGNLRMIAVDSTDIEEPGPTGSDWRLHYAIEMPGAFCAHAELTDKHGGESLCRYPVTERDLLCGDRNYCKENQIGHVLANKGHVLLRWHSTALPLFDAKGSPVQVLKWLNKAGRHGAERTVQTKNGTKLRLCALPVSKEAAERERAKLRESARKNGRQVSERSLKLAGYIVVVTTLPPEQFDTQAVLKLYKLRWQIELAFKRLKSLLNAGHVPKVDPDSVQAWLQTKLLTSLLVEKLLLEAEVFSPWGFILAEQQPLG